MERRFLPSETCMVQLESREGAKARTIVGYAARFYDGTPATEYRLGSRVIERINPGAFDRVLKENQDVRGLFNHDPSMLLGRRSTGTMKLSVDSKGLRYEITPPDTQVGRDVQTLIERGDLSGSSFSFNVGKDGQRWNRAGDAEVRTLTDIASVADCGPVTSPAYDGSTAALRSEDSAEALAELAMIDAQRRADVDKATAEQQAVNVRADMVRMDLE